MVVEPRDIYGSASQEARLMQLEGLAVIVKMEPALGEDAADQTKRRFCCVFCVSYLQEIIQNASTTR